MDNQWKRLTDFLVGHGIDNIGHTDKTYLGHLIPEKDPRKRLDMTIDYI